MACIARLGVTPQIKREFKRRAAIEPVIGHLKEHHRMGRNHLAHASGDAINAVLAAAGYNFRRLLAWLKLLLLRNLDRARPSRPAQNCPETEFFTDDSNKPDSCNSFHQPRALAVAND